MVNLPAPGQANWDVPLNTALAEMAHSGFTPAELGMILWNYPLSYVTTPTFAPLASGTLLMVRLPRLTMNATVNGIRFMVGTAGAGPVAGQNFAGLYDSTGALLAQTGDIGSSLTSTGMKYLALSAPYEATPGSYSVALLQNATTRADIAVNAAHSASSANAGLPPSIALFTSGPAGQTTLPASVTMASRTTVKETYWAAIS